MQASSLIFFFLLFFASERSSTSDEEQATTPVADVPKQMSTSVPVDHGSTPVELAEKKGSDLSTRARQIQALIDGTLAPDVDPYPLFRVELNESSLLGPGGELIRSLLQHTGTNEERKGKKRLRKRRRQQASLGAEANFESNPASAYRKALFAFFELDPQERAALFERHRQKREAIEAARKAEKNRAAKVGLVSTQAQQLEDFLEGRLALDQDPSALFQLNLADPDELLNSSSRAQGWLPSDDQTAAEKTAQAVALSTVDPLDAAYRRLDGLRQRFLALTKSEQQELFTRHRNNREAHLREQEEAKKAAEEESRREAEKNRLALEAKAEAREAAKEKAAALQAAERAKTEASRILAAERARLLGIKEEQARFEAALNQKRVTHASNHQTALEWHRRVQELESEALFASERYAQVDPMYGSIRSDLRRTRAQLRDELERVQRPQTGVPTVGSPTDSMLPPDVDRGDIISLLNELELRSKLLSHQQRSTSWHLAESLRNDVVSLNKSRLSLLEMVSPELQKSLTDFGAIGIDQCKGELLQISIELRFHLLRLSHYGKEIRQFIEASPVDWSFALVQALLLILLFIVWRRKCQGVITQLQNSLGLLRPGTETLNRIHTATWFLLRIRQPLEVLLVLALLFQILEGLIHVEGRLEFELLWIVILWLSLGLTVILFIDALAERETLVSIGEQDTSPLRIFSLRLVGLAVISIGLVLSLSEALVGRGAIYNWVWSTCGFFFIPLSICLVLLWRRIIFERAPKLNPPRLLAPIHRWTLEHQKGLWGFFSASIAAVFLLVGGTLSWALRQLSDFDTTRRLMAYFFRRELAKQKSARGDCNRYTPIDCEVYEAFEPNKTSVVLLTKELSKMRDEVAALAQRPLPTLSAVVGERGSGKSIFLRQVADHVESKAVHRLQCPEEGFQAFLKLFQEEVLTFSDEETAASRLGDMQRKVEKLGPALVLVDDIQRLIVPAVKGLRELDQFIAFTREIGGQISWMVSVGSAAWQYVRRARGDRVFYEQVFQLPKWSEEQIGELIRAQCKALNIQPCFESLAISRASSLPFPAEHNRSEASYYRLLWDFSKGNPAVALHAFRESLFRDPEDRLVVRPFVEPSAQEIEGLSLPILLVLRAIVQLELARTPEISAATQLTPDEVEETLRFANSRKYIVPCSNGFRLSWAWYRTITTVLQRQHLLSSL